MRKNSFKLTIGCLFLLMGILFYSCSKDSTDKIGTNEVFIEIDNDLRKPALVDKDYYQIELSHYSFSESYSEPAGIQFVMDIYDYEKKYVGDIGGMANTTEIELFVDAYRQDFDSKTTLVTFVDRSGITKEMRENKCSVFLRMKDKDDRIVAWGDALSDQKVTVQKINNTNSYKVDFKKLKFEGDDISFTGSARMITN